MTGVALVVAAACAVAAVLAVLAAPARLVRGLALGLAFVLCAFSVNDTAGKTLYLPTMALAIVLLALSVIRTRTGPSDLRLLQTLLVAWWALLLISSVVMGGYSLLGLLAYGTTALLAGHVALRLDADAIRLFVRIVLLLLVAEVGLAIAEALLDLTPVWGYRGSARDNPFLDGDLQRSQGTFGHPIVFGWFAAVAAVLVWCDAARLQGMRGGGLLRIVMLAVAATGLLLSGTRSAALAALAGVLVHLITRPGLTRWIRNLLLLGGVGALAVLLGAGGTIRSLADDLLDSGSWLQRLGNLQGVPALLARPPLELLFGQGWGRDGDLFAKGYLTSRFHLHVVDDMYVEALGTVGLVGLVVLLLGILVALVRADRAGRAVIVVVLSMMFSFDTMVWLFTGIASTVLLSLPRLKPVAGEEAAPSAAASAVGGAESGVADARAIDHEPENGEREQREPTEDAAQVQAGGAHAGASD